MTSVDRILAYIDFRGIKKTHFYSKAKLSNGYLDKVKELGADKIESIISAFEEINLDWLITGTGSMLKGEQGHNKIPLYSDVGTIGGSNMVAEDAAVYGTTEYINSGDLFPGATAAIRHYGDSMVEYPSGCILALREIIRPYDYLWGQDYVIEYKEYRVTKRVQQGENGIIKACSSNQDTYLGGSLIHQPIDINGDDIRRLFLVLGYIVKKHGGIYLRRGKYKN